jgi:hypothetical protein
MIIYQYSTNVSLISLGKIGRMETKGPSRTQRLCISSHRSKNTLIPSPSNSANRQKGHCHTI